MRHHSQSAARWLLALSALVLAAGGSIHGFAYPKAAAVAEHSMLPPFYQTALKGLWLSDSLSSLLLALVLASIATKPQLAAKPLLLLLALTPLGMSVVLFLTMGRFFASYVMLIAAAAALLAAALKPAHAPIER
jgi:hypothetical protein